MASAKPRVPSGNKLARSEITTIRLDPKLRYLAELAARKQRRSLSSFIEWAVEDTLARVPVREGPDWMTSVMAEAEHLWDVDAADRFAKLALRFPELMTHEEQILWKLVRENGYLWRGKYSSTTHEWTWTVQEGSLIFQRLRENWDAFQRVAAGEMPQDKLPSWSKIDPKTKTASAFDDMDDEIPI